MRYALITGATSGIGYEIAKLFINAGWGVVLVSSSGEHLSGAHERLLKIRKDCRIITITQDLSERGAAEQLYQAVRSIGIDIDALVNDAGFGIIGAADNIPSNMEEKMMTLNMITPVQLCKAFIRDMYSRRSGMILNVASTGAFEPGPYNGSYYATKAFIYSYSRALAYEAREHGVKVCTLCPGTTRTGFFTRAGVKTPFIGMSPERVALAAFNGLMKGREVVIPGAFNFLGRFAPEAVKMHCVAKVKKPRGGK
jgi:short-subunit dehydrogenase